jgi:hypothetical protein
MQKDLGLLDVETNQAAAAVPMKALQALNSVIKEKELGKYYVSESNYKFASKWLEISRKGFPSFIRAILSNVNEAKFDERESIISLAREVFSQLDAKQVNEPEILKQLLTEAHNRNSPSHRLALQTLTHLGLSLAEHKDLLNEILAELDNQNWDIRYQAAQILLIAGFAQHPEISNLILNFLRKELSTNSFYSDQEQKNILLFDHFGSAVAENEDILRLLLLKKTLLSHYKPAAAAENCLARWVGPVANAEPAKTVLLEAGKEQNPLIRRIVVKIIGKLAHKLAIAPDLFALLIKGVNDPDADCRREALKAFETASGIADVKISPTKVHEQDVSFQLLVKIVDHSIRSYGPEQVLLDLGDHIRTEQNKKILLNAAKKNDGVFVAVMNTFKNLEAKELVVHTDIQDAALQKILDQKGYDSDSKEAAAAWAMLDKMAPAVTADEKTMTRFQEMLSSKVESNQYAALRIFSKAGSQLWNFPKTIKLLLAIATHQEASLPLRRLAILAIGRLGKKVYSTLPQIYDGSTNCYKVLLKLTKNSNFEIQKAVIEAFSELGSDLGLEGLRFLIKSANAHEDSLRAAAITALGKVRPLLFTNKEAFWALLRAKIEGDGYPVIQQAVNRIFEAPFDLDVFSVEVIIALLQEVRNPDSQAAVLAVFANFGPQLAYNPKILKVLIKLTQVDEKLHTKFNETIIPASPHNCVTARTILAKLILESEKPLPEIAGKKLIKLAEIGYEPRELILEALQKIKQKPSMNSKDSGSFTGLRELSLLTQQSYDSKETPKAQTPTLGFRG